MFYVIIKVMLSDVLVFISVFIYVIRVIGGFSPSPRLHPAFPLRRHYSYLSHDRLFVPVIKPPILPGKFKTHSLYHMDMLDQALENSGQEKNEDSGSEDQVHLTAEDLDVKFYGRRMKRRRGGAQITFSQDGGMYVTAGEEGEQAAAIASVTSQGTLTLDPSVQYQFRADNGQGDLGQVTYRVVQVASDEREATSQVVSASSLLSGGQAVIQAPLSNGGSPTSESLGGEPRFAYYPAVSGAGDTAEVASLGQVAGAGGQFYVMMSPQDVLQSQRNIAPRAHTVATRMEGGPRSTRDERRRATHNEVERRRRDKINNWIVQLSKLIPDCATETKQGQLGSKGGILAKACDYITEIRTANIRMAESLKETERLSVDVDLLRSQCDELKNENVLLRQQLQQHGIVPPDMSGGNS